MPGLRNIQQVSVAPAILYTSEQIEKLFKLITEDKFNNQKAALFVTNWKKNSFEPQHAAFLVAQLDLSKPVHPNLRDNDNDSRKKIELAEFQMQVNKAGREKHLVEGKRVALLLYDVVMSYPVVEQRGLLLLIDSRLIARWYLGKHKHMCNLEKYMAAIRNEFRTLTLSTGLVISDDWPIEDD